MSLFDAHVHFWDPNARDHAWLAADPRLERPLLPAELDGPEGMIVVQADCRDEQTLDEVAWFGALAGEDRRIRGIVAFAPLERSAALGPHLDALVENPLVVGVRRLLQAEPAAFLMRPELIAGIQRLAARWTDAVLDALTPYGAVERAAVLGETTRHIYRPAETETALAGRQLHG